MAQIIQHDKNPAAEGATARVNVVGSTVSIATDTFTSWPPQGAKSHKMVTTSPAICSMGLPAADRPAASPGQTWSCRQTLRNGSVGDRSVRLVIVFYNGGAQLGSVATTATLAAGEIRTLSVDGAVAPASTTNVDVHVQRNSTVSPAVGDIVYADQSTLTMTAASVAYRPPADDITAVWTGADDASTQRYYDAQITLTPDLGATPPHVEVLVTDLSPKVAKVTVWRLSDDREMKVRGAVQASVVGALTKLDRELPPNVLCSYRAQMFDASDADGGYSASSSITASFGTWIMNPLDPAGAVEVTLVPPTGSESGDETDVDIVYPTGRRVGVLIAGDSRGYTNYKLVVETLTIEDRVKVVRMLSSYGKAVLPVLCVRTPDPIDIPRPFFVGVARRKRINVSPLTESTVMEHDLSGDEVAPPTPALFVPLLTRADINAAFATRSALNAAHLTRLALNRRYDLAGSA